MGKPMNDPRPIATKGLSGATGIEYPCVMSSATPRTMLSVARVTIKAGMRS